MTTRHIADREARTKFSDLMDSVHYGGQAVIIERSGKPMAAVIPIETYQQLIEERETRFQVSDRVQGQLPDVSPEEAEQDLAEAVTVAPLAGSD
jgi:prevent-host-death family protein